MLEVEPAAFLNAEQQVEIGIERSGFPRFVEPIDNVQVRHVRLAEPEIQRALGELAVAREVEPAEPHQASPPLSRVSSRATMSASASASSSLT